MWGGVKSRKHYGDHFKQWSATKGLDDLRRVLYQEPRPWFLAFSLHQRQHLLQDRHCARLVAWCASTVQLRGSREEKQEAYSYAQETFGMLTHSHKAGRETLFEYMRLCAVGRDLTTAYEWHKYWLDSHKGGRGGGGDSSSDGAALMQQYAWLLRVAMESPSDESAEDMAVAVKEGYSDRCCAPMQHVESGERVLAHFQPTAPEEEAALHGLFCAFQALLPRLRAVSSSGSSGGVVAANDKDADEGLIEFIEALPVTDADADCWLARGWPTASHCHNFPQLEAGVPVAAPTPGRPRLRDSLLHPRLLEKLEAAAFEQRNVTAVIAIIKWYQECVTMEKDKKDTASRRLHQRKLDGEELDVWRQFSDPTAQRFRAAVVEAGGLTPELYHYVISALAQTQPTAALRTVQRMRDSNLRLLDLSRAVTLVAAQGAPADQLRLFVEQLEEIAARRKLDDDFGISKKIEVHWKFQYTNLFHYMNAMDEAAFYAFLMQGLPGGPRDVQALLLASQAHGPTATEEDLVVLDEALRRSAVRHFRQQLGSLDVDTALDIITRHMPKLDIALVGSLPHFSDYSLPEADEIATDVPALAARMKGYSTVYVLDTSFVETGEAFLSLGREDGEAEDGGGTAGARRSLVLIPYTTLAQLGDSIGNANTFVTFDPALAEAVRGEPFLASQRLRSLSAFASQHPQHSAASGRHVRILHFTESLLAQALPRDAVIDQLKLRPDTSDNDHLLLTLSLLSSLVDPGARVVLCSDDAAMVRALDSARGGPLGDLFRTPVQVLGTQPPPAVDLGSGLINDNPSVEFDADAFEPKLQVSKALRHLAATGRAAQAVAPSSSSDWDDIMAASLADLSELDSHGESAAVPPVEVTAIDAAVEAAFDSPWLASLLGDEPAEEAAGTTLALVNSGGSPSHAADMAAAGSGTARREEELMNLYEHESDVVPVGVKMQEADDLGSVYSQFDIMDPEEAEQRMLERQASRSKLQHTGSGPGGKRRRTFLEKEMLSNRGASFKERQRMARQLSNAAGGRVPFNLRYKVVDANVNDPRNAHLRRDFEAGMRQKREHYKKDSSRRPQ